ncbi:MAG: hypothetical protein ABI599_14185 [Flavobacteriales bacterium]
MADADERKNIALSAAQDHDNMATQRHPILLMGLFSLLFGCKDGSSKAQHSDASNVQLEEITARMDPEEGWNDIFLKVTSEVVTDSSHVYIAKGLYKGKTVGLQFEVSSDIGAGLVDGKLAQNGFVANGVRIVSIGVESDEFVKALAELYEQPVPPTFTKREISATAFSLNENAVDLDQKDKYKMKLFLEEGDEQLYSEVYVNIDTDMGEIELAEKDQEYREPIIKIFSR